MKENIQSPPKDNQNFSPSQIIADREKNKKIILNERLAFIPIISCKVIISFILCEFYLSYAAYNKIDTPYIKLSICLIVFLFFYSYYLSVMVHATQTNVNNYFNKTTKKIQLFMNYQWKDCPFCNGKKFIRTSHCRTCQQCILMRDHHCPYTANCVGFNNIQYFLNFLFWGIYAIVYYNITCLKFFFKPDNINLNDGSIMPKYIKWALVEDFILNILFINAIIYLFVRTIVIIYDNYTTLDKERNPNVERNFICYNIHKTENNYKIKNIWNIGFLQHFYYCIGPTPLHLIFPLPKFKNYCIDENCPFFKQCRYPDKVQSLKYTLKAKNTDFDKLMDSLGGDPEELIKLAHYYYDGKEII